jgi:hypothetical protein
MAVVVLVPQLVLVVQEQLEAGTLAAQVERPGLLVQEMVQTLQVMGVQVRIRIHQVLLGMLLVVVVVDVQVAVMAVQALQVEL